MKRTFLVTVDGEDARKYWFEPAVILDHIAGNLEADASVSVVEITATHAKEREVIALAMQQTDDEDAFGDDYDYERWAASSELVHQACRELRALMEKKS